MLYRVLRIVYVKGCWTQNFLWQKKPSSWYVSTLYFILCYTCLHFYNVRSTTNLDCSEHPIAASRFLFPTQINGALNPPTVHELVLHRSWTGQGHVQQLVTASHYLRRHQIPYRCTAFAPQSELR